MIKNNEHQNQLDAEGPYRANETNESRPAESPVTQIRELLGNSAVLLPIPSGKKGPRFEGWQRTTLAQMEEPDYLARLNSGNMGVLLGSASGGICAIDIDSDEFVLPFMKLNPNLVGTLRSKGHRGCQIWVRITGEYPSTSKLSTETGEAWGEWRANGGQSVIHGIHPEGNPYTLLTRAIPAIIDFEDIRWPEELKLPWVKDPYDELVEAQGPPYTLSEGGAITINQMFFVEKYRREHLVTYDTQQGDFYEYSSEEGLWKRVTPDAIKRNFSDGLTEAAKIVGKNTFYTKRGGALLNDLANLLRIHSDAVNFEERPEAIHVRNGVLRFEGNEVKLQGFHPDFYSRNRCAYAFDPNAQCPRFQNELLGAALDPDDILLLQKWAGSVLLGRNPAQRMLLLTGTPGGGKSTVMTILERVIGVENIASLRTEHLTTRFEFYGFSGKSLLSGKDVDTNFLMHNSAHVLKALVGGDLLEAEKKGYNERVQLRGDFNVGITCNANINVHLDGDEGAWARRLLVIRYERPAATTRIPDFAERLLAEEGAGILRWMVEGAALLLEDLKENGDYVLSNRQIGRVEEMLSASRSVELFVEQGVEISEEQTIAGTELVSAYQEFCSRRGWIPLSDQRVNRDLRKHMARIHNIHQRNDIKRGVSTVRGYKGVSLQQRGVRNVSES